MAAMSASFVTFKTAVAPRMRGRAAKLTRATRGSVATRASVVKISVNEVKDHLDRGFVLVDIRDPDEARETGYKSSWKNIVGIGMFNIRLSTNFDAVLTVHTYSRWYEGLKFTLFRLILSMMEFTVKSAFWICKDARSSLALSPNRDSANASEPSQ